ncbi:MAG: hypothetical protein CM15mP58_11340 [Burkholderiaceae bacterium]|nr:MAG: hypothetical protein CM15mP58_11340 [Burkholderiaceae bacterium]
MPLLCGCSYSRFCISSGGIVADSLEMARYGKESKAEVLIVAGVRFMGETAEDIVPGQKSNHA